MDRLQRYILGASNGFALCNGVDDVCDFRYYTSVMVSCSSLIGFKHSVSDWIQQVEGIVIL